MSEDKATRRSVGCEFNPDPAHLGTIRFRMQAMDPTTGKSGYGKWMGALAKDVAEGLKTGLPHHAMEQEAYLDIYKDAAT